MDTLFFKKLGLGYPLICLHGYALDHTIWLKTASEMQSGINFILPDLRGHGRSYTPDGNYTMQSMAEDVLRVMDSLMLNKAFLAGHSMGGYISLAMAKNHPDRLSGLALVASHPFADNPEKKKSRFEESKKVRLSKSTDPIIGMAQKLSKKLEVINLCKSLISKTSIICVVGVLAGMANRLDMVNVMNTMNLPAFLIAGTDDQLIPTTTVDKMALKITAMRIERIDHAGHMPMLEQPAETAAALLKFITQVRK